MTYDCPHKDEDPCDCGCTWCTLLEDQCTSTEQLASHLSPDRAEAIQEFLRVLITHSTDMRRPSGEPNYYHGGILHVQVDDDNLEFHEDLDKGVAEKWDPTTNQWTYRSHTPEERHLAELWNPLTLTERALAVHYFDNPWKNPQTPKPDVTL